ncbi:MAG: IPTL-CTERM sorting domain-containing protein, partial [Betaproteobacteria bacterium]|nr:IPTL-CTERM sorting domain-containing protein [Betaproteobacteria bacterium]
DNIVESGGETVILTLTANAAAYTLSPASATRTIADDDSPQVVGVTVAAPTIPEAAGSTTFTFTRSGGSVAAQQAALTVNVTLSGTATFGASCAAGVDYTLAVVAPATAVLNTAPRTVTFPANNPATLTAAVTVTACNDSVLDPAETVTLTVAPPTLVTDYTVAVPAGSATATVTIIDDEIGITVAASSGAVPEGSAAVFNLSCSGASGQVTVNYTITGADAGVVITPSATTITMSCPTGGTVTVPTVNDGIVGNGRTVTLTITGIGQAPANVVVGAPSAATVQVIDDDRPLIIPTMSAFGLGLMSLMLGLVAFLRRRSLK